MKRLLLTISALALTSSAALAAGNGSYYGTLADGTWCNGIQQQSIETVSGAQGHAYLNAAGGSWLNGVGPNPLAGVAVSSGNTLRRLADGTWLQDFRNSPMQIAGHGNTTRLD